MRNSALFAIYIGFLAFVLGFAYGDLFGARYDFHLNEWQGLVGTFVAIVAAGVAYISVWTTQRVNVMIKEQDRITELLPGLRQVHELLLIPRGVLNSLRPQQRYQAVVLLDAAFHAQPGESLEDVVRRKLPLADDHLRWELARIIFALKSQAEIVKVGNEEVERCQTDAANITTFAPSAQEGLVETLDRVKKSYDRENELMGSAILALEAYAASIRSRISKAEARGEIIRKVLDKFFGEGS